MMQEVPKADVIVTNPTHFAVALKYDEKRMGAPIVVAKGADVIAARIREIATENNVPIFEAPPLARINTVSVADVEANTLDGNGFRIVDSQTAPGAGTKVKLEDIGIPAVAAPLPR